MAHTQCASRLRHIELTCDLSVTLITQLGTNKVLPTAHHVMNDIDHEAYHSLVNRLNNHNLTELWELTAMLSAVESIRASNGGLNALMPVINVENVTLLSRAVLSSSAAGYKKQILAHTDLVYVLNKLRAASRRTEHIGAADGPLDILSIVAPIANAQLRLQSYELSERIGREYAMLHDIPVRCRDELIAKNKGIIDLTVVGADVLGMSVPAFLAVGMAVYLCLWDRASTVVEMVESNRKHIERAAYHIVERRRDVLLRLIEERRAHNHSMSFTIHDVIRRLPGVVDEPTVARYLGHVSQTTRSLREALCAPHAQTGLLPDRYSPLERHPIVRFASDRYIIPNVRYFMLAVTDILHFILTRAIPSNGYNKCRGYVQEIYVAELLAARLPVLYLIPETKYKRKTGSVDGPDLTVIEPSLGTMAIVELKAKRSLLATRTDPLPSLLDDDLQVVVETIVGAQEKIDDLYAGKPEYAEHQLKIDRARAAVPMIVVVIGDGLQFLGELLERSVRNCPDHRLRTVKYPYCLMRLEVFERMVEVAASNAIPLYDLLIEYEAQSKKEFDADHRAEDIKHRTYDHDSCFALRWYEAMFERILDELRLKQQQPDSPPATPRG